MLARAYAPSPSAAVAVVLNRHARGVTPRMVERLRRLVPARDLFVSESVRDSDAIAAIVIERGYRAALLGGGDGTFVRCVTDLSAHAQRRGMPVPSLGVLRLGTGNALAFALAASEVSEAGLRRDLDRARTGGDALLPLLEVDGRLTPFAGVGLDAAVQQDFAATTRALDRVGVGQRLGAGARYALAVGLRTVPRYLLSPLPEITVINRGAPAFRVGAGGAIRGPAVAAGEVLYRGRCSIATGSTIPYFGLGMRMFPYCQLVAGRFQLRCADVPTVEALAHLPSVWRGVYASRYLSDFLVEKVELRLETPVAFQIGGDLQDEPRTRVTLAMARPIRVVR